MSSGLLSKVPKRQDFFFRLCTVLLCLVLLSKVSQDEASWKVPRPPARPLYISIHLYMKG